jgi:nitroimidazol reductase NimA-like FMN-containing flavoprotein (pyridoxamine 5'-phosphate oxidase superfamily)
MEHPAISILNANRIMAISTVRPDGWPQTTVVGYANRGFDIFFLIFRKSQKYANIQHDARVSVAVAPEPADLEELKAVYAGLVAEEITSLQERDEAWRLLMERHANLAGFQMPDASEAVFMRGKCRHVSMLDFTQSMGHREQFTVAGSGVVTDAGLSKDDWGVSAAETFGREGMGVAAKE